jgi:hypothetical protein
LTFSWTIKPWFLTEEKLAAVLIILSSWDSQLVSHFHHHHRSHQAIFLAPLPGKNKTSAREFRRHILYFVLSSALLYFTCVILYQKHKKFSFLLAVTLLLLVHHVIP